MVWYIGNFGSRFERELIGIGAGDTILPMFADSVNTNAYKAIRSDKVELPL